MDLDKIIPKDGPPINEVTKYIEKYKGTKNHTAMEHNWDEAYGYFGAARDYTDYTDDEIAGKATQNGARKKYHDTNGDGKIDLTSEYNFGNSVNAAKRDRGRSTDFTKNAFDAWIRGRAIITAHHGKNFEKWSDSMKADLRAQVAAIGAAWEGAVAATVIHYINDVLADMSKFDTDDYNYADHAKHWGELKGFALGLQFNPNSPLHEERAGFCYTAANGIDYTVTEVGCTGASGEWTAPAKAFVQLHEIIGDEPCLDSSPSNNENWAKYQAYLDEANNIIKEAFAFNAEDVANW